MTILRKAERKKNISDFAGCWKGYPEDPDEFIRNLRKLWHSKKT